MEGNSPQRRIGRKVLGPFQILDTIGRFCVPVTAFPFTDVQGGTVSVVLQGNLSISPAGGTFSEAMFEVEIVGIVQGQEDCLVRGWLSDLSGPLRKTFEEWDVYETIEIRARNMVGGRTGGNVDPQNIPPVDNSTAAGFFVNLTVNLQPRRPQDSRIVPPPKPSTT